MKTILLFAFTAMVAFAQTGAEGAIIFGTVQSDTGAAIPGAWVTIYRDTVDPDKPAPPSMVGKPSWQNGAFAFSGLEAGVYHFCAAVPGSTWLNTCDWETQRVTAEVKANQMLRGIVVTMRRGVVLPVRIDDDGEFMDKHEKSRAGAHVLVGVSTASGKFQPAEMKSGDKKRRSHEVLVPFDAPVKLVVQSALFQLADDKGTALTSGRSETTVTIPRGRAADAVAVKVLGIKP